MTVGQQAVSGHVESVVNRQDSFAVGDEVGIIRHRHGWENGSITGHVTKVGFRSGGAAYYTVEDENGGEYDINATKDLFAY